MCQPRVSVAGARRLDVSHFLPPRIELSDPGHHRPVLRCSGELDTASAADLGAALDAACEREVEELLLDFVAVEFIDGRVLALIERTRLRLQRAGATLRIRAGGQPLRLLRLTGIVSGDAETAPRFEPWLAPSSSSSFPTLTSERPGAAAIL